MKPTEVFDIQLVDESGRSIHLAGVSVSIDFFLKGSHRYGFRLGPTDAEGHLTVRYEDVEARRLENLKAQPWDYKTRLEECDPLVVFSVPSQDELNAAVTIATSFNLDVLPPDVEWWSRANNRLLSCRSTEARDGEVEVNIVCAWTK